RLQGSVSQRMRELEAWRSSGRGDLPIELDLVLPVAVTLRTAELRQLADPAAWDERCCLAKDVGEHLKAGWCLMGGEALDDFAEELHGTAHQAALQRLQELTKGRLPFSVDCSHSLALGMPILEAAGWQMRLLAGWVARQRARQRAEEFCSRSFGQAMLAESTAREKRRLAAEGFHAAAVAQQHNLEQPLLPARYEDRLPWVEYRTAERLVASSRSHLARRSRQGKATRSVQGGQGGQGRGHGVDGFDTSSPAAFWSKAPAPPRLPPPPPPPPPPP
ncbi:unnamed protein product, partial [Effrenium voratum]